MREGFREQSMTKLERLYAGFILIILSGLLRIWGLRYDLQSISPKFSRLRRAEGQLDYPFQNAPPRRRATTGTYPLRKPRPTQQPQEQP